MAFEDSSPMKKFSSESKAIHNGLSNNASVGNPFSLPARSGAPATKETSLPLIFTMQWLFCNIHRVHRYYSPPFRKVVSIRHPSIYLQSCSQPSRLEAGIAFHLPCARSIFPYLHNTITLRIRGKKHLSYLL